MDAENERKGDHTKEMKKKSGKRKENQPMTSQEVEMANQKEAISDPRRLREMTGRTFK